MDVSVAHDFANAKRRAKLIVLIEWILFVIVAFVVIGAMTVFFSMDRESKRNFADQGLWETPAVTTTSDSEKIAEIVMYILAVSVFVSLIFDIVLTIGVYKERHTWCKVWYIFNMVGIAFQVMDFAKVLFSLQLMPIVIHGLALAYRIYAVRTIMAYCKELKLHLHQNSATPGVIYTAPPGEHGPGPGYGYGPGFVYSAPTVPARGFVYGNPPPYDADTTKNPPAWNNYPNNANANADYPRQC